MAGASTMWISAEVFEWEPSCDGGYTVDPSRVSRAHEILRHAEELVVSSASALSLADAILNLKRAINSRLQHLDQLYRFSEIFPRNVGALERLNEVGLTRPFLIKQLFELRNNIEHNDAPPPPLDRCRELLDVVWYFLKTTDDACQTVPTGVVLHQISATATRSEPLWVSVRLAKDSSDHLQLAGWLSFDQISKTPKDGYLPMSIQVSRTKPNTQDTSGDSIALLASLRNSTRGDDERWIESEMTAPNHILCRFWRLALNTL